MRNIRKIVLFLVITSMFSLGLDSYAQLDMTKKSIPYDISPLVRQEIERLYLPDSALRLEAIKNLEAMGTQAAPAAPFLIQLFGDDSEKIKSAAIQLLGMICDQKIEGLLIEAMKSENSLIREGAVDALSIALMRGLEDPKLIEQIIGALSDSDPKVRRKTALALGKIKDAKAVEPLITLLGDSEPQVRWMAVSSLGEIKDPRAVEPIIAALSNNDPDIKIIALSVLAKMNDPRAVEPIIALIANDNQGTRKAAIAALGAMKDPRGFDPLIEQLKNMKSSTNIIQRQIVYSLADFNDPRAIDPLTAALDEVSDENIRTIIEDTLEELKKQ